MAQEKILIVEDEAVIALQIKNEVRSMGYQVVGIHATGEEALAGVAATKPDLVLMDIKLQGELDGIETASRIAREYDLPVVFLTAHSEDSTLARVAAAGPYGYLLKPVGGHELRIAVQLALSKHESDREKAELTRELQESRDQLREVAANLGAGVFSCDREGVVTFMNQTAEVLLGYTIAELNAKGVHALVHFLRPDGTPLPLAECRLHGVTQGRESVYSSSEEVFVRKGGELFPVSVICTPYLRGGEVVGSVTAFRDFTREKHRGEEQLNARKLESVGILAGGIAHDFNNLLTAIMGNIELAKIWLAAREPERVPPLLEAAEKASQLAKDLSYRLLTFSKGGEPVRKTASLVELLRRAAEFVVRDGEVRVEYDLAAELWLARIDTNQLMQVLRNLFRNACDARPRDGKITVVGRNSSLAAHEVGTLPAGDYVRLAIRDNGCGIARDHLSRIFDPYFSTKSMGQQKGMGLGLAICRSIIDKHEGYIGVESEEGVGTTVQLYLPAAEREGALTAAVRGGEEPARRILFMDDEEAIRRVIGEVMAVLGYEVDYAENGEEAIAVYRRAMAAGVSYVAVILDLTVKSGLGGEETVRRLLALDPGVRAIISTGYVDSPVVREYRKYGFVDVIVKPYRLAQLQVVLARQEECGRHSRK